MSLSNHAKNKALAFIEEGYRQADPGINTNTGSAVRATVVLPMSMIYASLIQEIEVLRNLHLGNAANLSEEDMNMLAGLVQRPQGSRATTMLRMYLDDMSPFTLETTPYFSSSSGALYRPISSAEYGVSDFMEEDGEIYVNVPIISVAVGPAGVAAANSITGFAGVPAKVRRVTNISDTQGGSPSMSNTEFLSYLEDTINDLTIGQIGGIRQYIADNFPEATNIQIVPAGDPRMERDEVWTEDGIHPNLDRIGEPFAAHIDLGVLDFDVNYRRATSANPIFDETFVGRRIAIDGDIDKFRTILAVVDEHSVILSGYPQIGTANAKVWNSGPHIGNMADVYMYFPALHIKTAIVDKRYRLTATNDVNSGTTLVTNVAPGFGYTEVPETGVLVVREGSDDEIRLRAISATGGVYTLSAPITEQIRANDPISLYDMSTVEIGEDITDRPIIYVLQVDQLDPLSLEAVQTIPRSEPGPHNGPGWYIGATDSAEIFSAKENKTIFLDNKSNYAAFQPLNIPNASIVDSTESRIGSVVLQGNNRISHSYDWSYSEGREITITTPNTLVASWSGAIEEDIDSGAGTSTLEVQNTNIQFQSLVGYRDDITVVAYNGPTQLGIYRPGDLMGYGNRLELNSGTWPASTTRVRIILPSIMFVEYLQYAPMTNDQFVWVSGSSTEVFPDDPSLAPRFYRSNMTTMTWDDITDQINTRACIYGEEIETVILATDGSTYIDVLPNTPLPGLNDASGQLHLNVTITASATVENLNSSPVRVMYATQADIASFQSTLDAGSVQSLCKNTLARSYLPSLIDATIRFRGESSASDVYNKFVDLLSTASAETEGGVRLDISNIVAEIDEEGLADYIDVNFEIRVTNHLSDGETVVQYINPSENTKQNLACNGLVPAGSKLVELRRLSSVAPLPGRGKLLLGGNNPAIQEALPYEAVIDNGNDTYTFVLRSSMQTAHNHADWETATVAVRDYDPELEFTEGAIFIPSTNRPYVRHLVVIKL